MKFNKSKSFSVVFAIFTAISVLVINAGATTVADGSGAITKSPGSGTINTPTGISSPVVSVKVATAHPIQLDVFEITARNGTSHIFCADFPLINAGNCDTTVAVKVKLEKSDRVKMADKRFDYEYMMKKENADNFDAWIAVAGSKTAVQTAKTTYTIKSANYEDTLDKLDETKQSVYPLDVGDNSIPFVLKKATFNGTTLVENHVAAYTFIGSLNIFTDGWVGTDLKFTITYDIKGVASSVYDQKKSNLYGTGIVLREIPEEEP